MVLLSLFFFFFFLLKNETFSSRVVSTSGAHKRRFQYESRLEQLMLAADTYTGIRRQDLELHRNEVIDIGLAVYSLPAQCMPSIDIGETVLITQPFATSSIGLIAQNIYDQLVNTGLTLTRPANEEIAFLLVKSDIISQAHLLCLLTYLFSRWVKKWHNSHYYRYADFFKYMLRTHSVLIVEKSYRYDAHRFELLAMEQSTITSVGETHGGFPVVEFHSETSIGQNKRRILRQAKQSHPILLAAKELTESTIPNALRSNFT